MRLVIDILFSERALSGMLGIRTSLKCENSNTIQDDYENEQHDTGGI
jgi:hypothetical protein